MAEDRSSELLLQDLARAADGDKVAAERFFKSFLQIPLYVAERHQAAPLSHQPEYPNDFFNILAIQEDTRIVVPLFSSEAHLLEWFGRELTARRISGAELVKLIPEEWWIIVEPGQEVQKEISPWEISQLKLGPSSIPEIVAENFSESRDAPLVVNEIAEELYPRLVSALRDVARSKPQIQALYLAGEGGGGALDEPESTLLLGIVAAEKDQARIEELRSELSRIAQQVLIGDRPIQTFISPTHEDLAFGAFQGQTPIYRADQSEGVLNRLKSLVLGPRNSR